MMTFFSFRYILHNPHINDEYGWNEKWSLHLYESFELFKEMPMSQLCTKDTRVY